MSDAVSSAQEKKYSGYMSSGSFDRGGSSDQEDKRTFKRELALSMRAGTGLGDAQSPVQKRQKKECRK